METLGKTADGANVVNRYNSHLHANVASIISEAIGKISSLNRNFIQISVDLGRNLGSCTCVDTSDNDKIIFAQRINRKGLTRFVLGREPVSSSKITLVLKQTTLGNYILITSYIGELGEHEPWDQHATERSVDFWNKKALLWGTEPVIENTITINCPW